MTELERRYGPMVELSQLAEYFHAAQRAVRAVLEREGIPILQFGSTTVVPLRAVETAFGLDDLTGDEDAYRRARYDTQARLHADGTPKTMERHLADVRERAPRWRAVIEQAEPARPVSS